MAKKPTIGLAEGIAAGLSIREAAARSGVSYATARRRVAEPEFKAEVSHLRGAMIADLGARLLGACEEALATLEKIASDPKATDGTRVRAALGILSKAAEWLELGELEQRVAALEAAAKDGAT